MRRAGACVVVAIASLLMLTPVGCSSSPRPPRVTAPKLLSAVWSPEAGGLCVQLDRGLDELGSDGLMGGTQLRLSGPTLPRSVYAEPTPAGAMCFRIAESPAEMRRIKPGPVTVHALIDGDLYEVDTRLLDQTSLDRLFEWSLAESRSESGIAGPGGSVEIEYRDQRDKLLAVSICDVSRRSISSVYHFFDPDEGKRSLGVYSVIKEIELCREKKIPYYYLGYWIEGCSTMDYKRQYQPHELLIEGEWKTGETAKHHDGPRRTT